MTTSPRALHLRLVAWAACIGGAVAVAALPGDPGSIPAGWIGVLALLAFGAARGSTTCRVLLAGLNGLLLAPVLLVSAPVDGTLWAFFGLLALALLVLVVPVVSPAAASARAGRRSPSSR